MVQPKALRTFEPRIGPAPASPPEGVVQLAATAGEWVAMFRSWPGDGSESWVEPVAAWALVQRPGGRAAVVGMVPGPGGELEEAALFHGAEFLGYARRDAIEGE